MGYVQLGGGLPSSNQMIISIWFRIPAASLAAARAAFDGLSPDDTNFDGYQFTAPALAGIIPFLVFGADEGQNPSFIGVDVHYGPGKEVFTTNLQTAASSGGQTGSPQEGPDEYYMQGNPDGTPASGVVVTPDEWHHALVSFNLSGCSCTVQDGNPDSLGNPSSALIINSSSLYYLAFDDVNKDGYDLGPSGGWLGGTFGAPNFNPIPNIGRNGIISQNSLNISNIIQGTTSLGSTPIPTAAVGVPASGVFADSIYPTTMAHLQIFTGETIDTSDVAMRRLFVDDNGEPTDPAVAIEYFGKLPDVAFHAGTDWKTGTNVGTAGDFTPSGTILKTGPNPKLGA